MASLEQIHADISIRYSQVALQLRELQVQERDLASALGVVVQQLRQAAQAKEEAAKAAPQEAPAHNPAPVPVADSAQ